MIDIAHEKLIPVRDVPRLLPLRPTGKRIHISAVYRWLQRGRNGIRLESVTIGGTTYTSQEALQRFAERPSQTESPPLKKPIATKSRQNQIEQAAQRVKKLME